ncbi:MAG: MBL fold metallo-hydrolase [Verrucomicrobiae bacterium]|jgi:hydroxyacylglutathione hydrolase|nr:MBL fold metallo-hydrolase [Verrucomicrobiae bacterium]
MKIEAFSLGPFETNAYLITSDDGQECSVVDAPQRAATALLPLIKVRGLKLTHLLLTHGHWDHMCEAHAFAAAGAQVLAHRADRELIENIEAYKDRYLSMIPSLSEEDFHSVKVTTWLEEGSTFVAAGKSFATRHVPGHCPGSLLFYCASDQVAFCGDAIFRGSVGRTDLPNGNWNELLTSIRTRVYTLPDETVLLPGHGGRTTVGQEKQTNPYARP